MKTKVLILCGGQSEEHEISLISAKHVLEALDRNQFDPVLVGITKEGVWLHQEENSFLLGEVQADKVALNPKAPTVHIAPYPVSGKGLLVVEEKHIEFDVAFPVLHGDHGEDGTMQGLFEIMGIAYVGAGSGSSWNCMDKIVTKSLCEKAGIPSAPFVSIRSSLDLGRFQSAIAALGKPLFVKPNRTGSSVGVSKVTENSQLETAVREALKHDQTCLIEKAITGREIECAVLGLNQSAKASLPGEIIPTAEAGFYSYEAKYLLKDAAELVVPANLDQTIIKNIQELALKAFQTMDCDGMARVDMFLENQTNQLYLNELNTIPGFTPISMYPKMWEASGLAYKDLVTELVQLAFQRKG